MNPDSRFGTLRKGAAYFSNSRSRKITDHGWTLTNVFMIV
jgi:hypothetical protein